MNTELQSSMDALWVKTLFKLNHVGASQAIKDIVFCFGVGVGGIYYKEYGSKANKTGEEVH